MRDPSPHSTDRFRCVYPADRVRFGEALAGNSRGASAPGFTRPSNRAKRFPRTGFCATVWLAAGLSALGLLESASAIDIEFAMSTDPKIEAPTPIRDINPRPLPLWIAALSAAEVDLQRETARTIALAHAQGMSNVKTTVPALIAAMEDSTRHPSVVTAVAQALIALDARQAAGQLFERSKTGGTELARIIEPALARWDFRPIRRVWLERLADPHVDRASLLLAVEGLAAVGEKSAAPRLAELATSPLYQPLLRLAAARALARVQPEGWEERVRKMPLGASTGAVIDRLVGATIVARLNTPAAKQLLTEFAVDPEPAVAAIALGGLYELDFRLILPLAGKLVSNDDAHVRHWVAKAWVAERTTAAVGRLCLMLDDPHPTIRAYVRESLLTLAAAAEFRQAVIDGAVQMLATDKWRGLEQAVMIMVALDQKQTANRLVQLIDHPRPEVFVAAAWGLRRMAVPSTLAPMLRRAERVYAVQKVVQGIPDLDRQSRHLSEAMGLMHYAEAVPLLQKYIPKILLFDDGVRAAAIWALGHIFAGNPRPDIVEALEQRVEEFRMPRPMPPESLLVIEMSAVSLGRMRAVHSLPLLRRYGGGKTVSNTTQYACSWAIHVMTNEPLPAYTEIRVGRSDWFLEPVD
jgi:HEAT repeat protein